MTTNALAESFKETLSTDHVLHLTSRLTKTDRMIAILDAAQSLVHEGYSGPAETLLSLVKRILKGE